MLKIVASQSSAVYVFYKYVENSLTYLPISAEL